MHIGEKLVEQTEFWDIETEITGAFGHGRYTVRRRWKWRDEGADRWIEESLKVTHDQLERMFSRPERDTPCQGKAYVE
jgi:hypothetical protein